MNGRWGAITKVGGINLNANLIKAPEEVIEYIIIHELVPFYNKRSFASLLGTDTVIFSTLSGCYKMA